VRAGSNQFPRNDPKLLPNCELRPFSRAAGHGTDCALLPLGPARTERFSHLLELLKSCVEPHVEVRIVVETRGLEYVAAVRSTGEGLRTA
jgi:hypothetical protein